MSTLIAHILHKSAGHGRVGHARLVTCDSSVFTSSFSKKKADLAFRQARFSNVNPVV